VTYGKTFWKVATGVAEGVVGHAVRVEPLAHQPAIGEMGLARAVELLGEQPRHPGDPEIRRLVEDDVERPLDRPEHAPRVRHVELHALVVERTAGLAVEVPRRADHRGRDLDAVDFPRIVLQARRERHARTEADQRDPVGLRMGRQRDVGREQLRHEIDLAQRGVGLAVDPQHAVAVGCSNTATDATESSEAKSTFRGSSFPLRSAP
jgi:hypothetical protein